MNDTLDQALNRAHSDVVLIVDAADTGAVNELITQARELDDVVSTKTRLILDERRG